MEASSRVKISDGNVKDLKVDFEREYAFCGFTFEEVLRDCNRSHLDDEANYRKHEGR